MTQIIGQDSVVHFGGVDRSLPDWREDKDLSMELDPDDVELLTTPGDVVAMLGFDPK